MTTITRIFYRTNLFMLMLLPLSGCTTTTHTVPEFNNFIQKAKTGKPIVIAYLGGSITCGEITSPVSGTNAVNKFYNYTNYNPEKDSWRAKTFEWLRNNFEQKPGQFRQINAAIGGTPSLLGAYRLEQDVLSENPDLVFVEFAVNDNDLAKLTFDNPNATRSILRTTCSIIERLRKKNPNVAIFMPLSTHRVLGKSVHTPWEKNLDLSHDQTLLSAEFLKIPYVSLRKAFYDNPKNGKTDPFYDGPDSPGNFVHPSPHGHHAYAEAVKKSLAKIFKTKNFDFKLPKKKRKFLKPSPIIPKFILPETLLKYSKGWKVKNLDTCETPILENNSCLISYTNGALEYTFKGTAVALWFDSQTKGILEIYLDGKMIGIYTNGVKTKGDFQGRFCSLADTLNKLQSHILRLVPVSESNVAPSQIFLRALAIDAD